MTASTTPILAAQQNTPLFDIIRHRRGWNAEFFNTYLADNAMPAPLDHSDQAITIIHECMRNNDELTIITDYDMDGIAAGTLGFAAFNELGVTTNLITPDYTGSRDITPADIDNALQLHPNTRVIMTCDAGTNSVEAANYARQLGISFIVTDHHVQTTPITASALINPNKIDSTDPANTHSICGSQVVYLLAIHYCRTFNLYREPAIHILSVFAGIGTCADVMPLTHWNRSLVRHTLALLRLAVPDCPVTPFGSWDKHKALSTDVASAQLSIIAHTLGYHPAYHNAIDGLVTLIRSLIAAGKLRTLSDIDDHFIGFTVAPMFNAIRRIEADMNTATDLLCPTSTSVTHYEPEDAAARIIDINNHRKLLVRQELANVYTDYQPHAPIVYYSTAMSGVLGLLASMIMHDTGKPTIVINPDTLSGSARSPEWFPMIDMVASMQSDGLEARGHQYACGVNAANRQQLGDFSRMAQEFITNLDPSLITPAHADLHLTDILSPYGIDDHVYTNHIAPRDVDLYSTEPLEELIDLLQAMGPFGHGIEYPTIDITIVPRECDIATIGNDNQHIKITTPIGLQLLWWNAADDTYTPDITDAEAITATIELGRNIFKGQVITQGIIRTVITHQPPRDDEQAYDTTVDQPRYLIG